MAGTLTARIVAIALSACAAGSAATAQTTFEKAKDQAFVTMGFTNEVPYSYSEDGKLTGADTVVVTAILEKIGIPEVVGVLTEFQSLIPGLMARRFDLNSTMYIRPSRCEQIDFTDPVWAVGDAIIVPAGNPKSIHSYQDVAADPSIRIGYLAGGAAIVDHMRLGGVADDQAVPFPDPAAGAAAVRTGRVDGFANTALANQTLLDRMNDDRLERALPFEQPEQDGTPVLGFGALGFRKEDRDFYDAFNTALKEYLGSPEHLEAVRPFGITEVEVELAKAQTAEALCDPQ